MPTIQHHGATLYYEEYGQGFPILTFAPAGLRSMRCPARLSFVAGCGTGGATMRPLSGCSMIVPGFGFCCSVGGVCAEACEVAASIHTAKRSAWR